ncbi:MAG: helix-turn-helix domain-containing protein [Chlamydiales bacterium]|nr:helix-turn-helix domain-containing protein [Chlamydiales bacterium]
MTSKELARKKEVERALDHWITQRKVSEKFGMSERQFRRILRRYRQDGDGGLVSRKRGKPIHPSRTAKKTWPTNRGQVFR